MLRGIRRFRRWVFGRPYQAEPGREQNAMDLWKDAALKGGIFWAMLVGEHERGRGTTQLSRWCGHRCDSNTCLRQGCMCLASVCVEHRLKMLRQEFE